MRSQGKRRMGYPTELVGGSCSRQLGGLVLRGNLSLLPVENTI